MDQKISELSEKIFRKKYEHLDEREKKVAARLAERTPISRNVANDFSEQLSFGQRIADRVTSFGGSWTFISIFGAVLFLWILLNFLLLIQLGSSFDPYPYILLLRNGTSIGTGVNATGAQINTFLSGPALPGAGDAKTKYKYVPATRVFLDSPANTSALTYQIQFAQPFSGAPAYLNRQANTDNNTYIQSVASSITLMEIAA